MCLGIIKPLKFPGLRAIGLTQQAVARRQHSSTALCGTANSLHWLAEYSRKHYVSLALPHANGKYAGLTSASVTGSREGRRMYALAHSSSMRRTRHEAVLYILYSISTLSSSIRRARHEAA